MSLPVGFDTWNPALRGAFKKGMRSQQAGEAKSACPYQDKRKPSGRLSWSRAFITAWHDGWEWAAGGNSYAVHEQQGAA